MNMPNRMSVKTRVAPRKRHFESTNPFIEPSIAEMIDAGTTMATRAWNLPTSWTLDNWSLAWTTLSPAMLRSVAMVVPASIISAMLGSMNGFVLSKWRFRGANLVFTLILFGMFIPYQAVMI